MVENTI